MQTVPTRPMPSESPAVWLIGEVDRPEFTEAVALVRATARVTQMANARQAAALLAQTADPPELVVLAASRPGVLRSRDVRQLRRTVPIAGMVAMLGTWCEGETRTGRPWPGVARIYWYDFPNWWRRQLSTRSEGRCPDWAWPASREQGARSIDSPCSSLPAPRSSRHGLIVLDTTCYETADALAAVLRPAGFATAWTNFGHRGPHVRGAVAGLWEGRQLDQPEAARLAAFCGRLADDGTPVVAMLDFPRRDRCELARQAGAAAVLAKPWRNADLIAALDGLIDRRQIATALSTARAA